MKIQKIESTTIWKQQHLKRFIAGMVGYGFIMPLNIFIGKRIEAGISVMPKIYHVHRTRVSCLPIHLKPH